MGKQIFLRGALLSLLLCGQAIGQFSVLADNQSGFSLSAAVSTTSRADVWALGGAATFRGQFDLQFNAENTQSEVGRDFTSFVLSGSYLLLGSDVPGLRTGVGPILGYEYQNFGEAGGTFIRAAGKDSTSTYYHTGIFAFAQMQVGSFRIAPKGELVRMHGRDDAPSVTLFRAQLTVLLRLSEKNAISLSPFVRLTNEDVRSEIVGVTLSFHGWNPISGGGR